MGVASIGRCLLALGLLLGAPASPATAGEDDKPRAPAAGAIGDVPAQVRAWIQDLASDSYAVREQARQGLERWGRQAPEVLREFAESSDAEVRRTVRALLERLESVVENVPPAQADISRIGLVKLEAHGEALRKVLAGLSASVGGQVRAPGTSGATPITLSLDETPCFTAIETLAALLSLEAPGAFDADGALALAPRAEGLVATPTGATGPVRVRATRVQVSRPLDAAGPSTHALTLEIQLAPCVQLVSYRAPRVVAAADAEGRRWRSAGGIDGSTTFGVGGDPRKVDSVLTLEPAAAGAAERLERLELGLELRLRHERRELVFEGFEGLPRTLDEQGRSSEAARKGSITLEAVEAAEGRPDALTVELSCVLASGVARASVEPWVELADGSRRRLWIVGGRSTTSADGRLRVVGRAHGVGGGVAKAVHVVWFERESSGDLTVLLRDVPLR